MSHPVGGTSWRWRTIGSVAALASLPLHVMVDAQQSATIAAVTLSLVAAIYVGFALSDGRRRIVGVEAGVALLFATAAYLSVVASPWFAPAAFIAHGLWDIAHDHGISTSMPRWYIPFCAMYDWVFAIGLAAIILLKG